MRIVKLTQLVALLPFLLPFFLPMSAKADQLGVGIGVGTLGAELYGSLKLNRHMDVIAGYSALDYDDTFAEAGRSSVKAEATIDAPRIGVQFYPFARSGLFIEGGMVFGSPNIKVTLEADENGDYTVDGEAYSTDDVGNLRGEVGFANDSAPYALIGWGRVVGNGIGLNFSMGAISYGAANAELTSDCTYTLVGGIFNGGNVACTNVRTALANEELKIDNDLEDFELWPFVRIGLSYSF